MAYEVEWAESAVASLIEAVEYIAKDSPSYAGSLALIAEQAAASLTELPHRGRRVGEYHDPDIRELVVGKSYRLIYRVHGSTISVIAFVHVARDLRALIEDSSE